MFYPPSFTYADESRRRDELVAVIMLLFALWAFLHKERLLPANLQLAVLGVLLFVIFLFGWELYERSTQVRQAWWAEKRRVEGFHEQRRERFRARPEPWRGFLTPTTSSCPNVLVRKQDGKFYLYDTSLPDTVITNPIVFKTISEYITYWKMQKSTNGSSCPVAYLQEDLSADPHYYEIQLEKELNDAVAMDRLEKQVRFYLPKDTQRADREPDAAEAGDSSSSTSLPGPPRGSNHQGVWTRANEKSLRSQLGGFDVPLDQTATGVGVGVPGVSANPMDPNWGGGYYTRLLREEGYFRHGAQAYL